jgi:hypothetical protein
MFNVQCPASGGATGAELPPVLAELGKVVTAELNEVSEALKIFRMVY